MKSDITYSLEEITPVDSHFSVWHREELNKMGFTSTVLRALEDMSVKRLADYGVGCDMDGGIIYVVRSHHALPVLNGCKG